ncbi:hypothetical protein L204_101624 [Cryptococcus depauperatus]
MSFSNTNSDSRLVFDSPSNSTFTRKLTLPRSNEKVNQKTGKKHPNIFRTKPRGARYREKEKCKEREEKLERRRIDLLVPHQKRKRDEDRDDGGNNRLGCENDGSGKMSRARVTEKMMRTLGREENPITNSDLPKRSDHVISCAIGHQRAEQRGATMNMTYAKVRTAQLETQSRAKKTGLFKGCLFYFTGSTGPKVSSLQLRNLISENGGCFTTIQTSACTHIIANNGLSGSKTQKHLDLQGGRRSSSQARIVRVEWLLDSVDKGRKLSEAGYGTVKHPTQPDLFDTIGVKPLS